MCTLRWGYGYRGWGWGPSLVVGWSWGWGPPFPRYPSREQRIRWLEAYQRDLEEQVAGVADEIRRLREASQPQGA